MPLGFGGQDLVESLIRIALAERFPTVVPIVLSQTHEVIRTPLQISLYPLQFAHPAKPECGGRAWRRSNHA